MRYIFKKGKNKKFDFRQVWKFCWDLCDVISGGSSFFRWDWVFSGGTLYPSENYGKCQWNILSNAVWYHWLNKSITKATTKKLVLDPFTMFKCLYCWLCTNICTVRFSLQRCHWVSPKKWGIWKKWRKKQKGIWQLLIRNYQNADLTAANKPMTRLWAVAKEEKEFAIKIKGSTFMWQRERVSLKSYILEIQNYTGRTSLSYFRASFWLLSYKITFPILFTKLHQKQLRQSPFKSILQDKKPFIATTDEGVHHSCFRGNFQHFQFSLVFIGCRKGKFTWNELNHLGVRATAVMKSYFHFEDNRGIIANLPPFLAQKV